MTRTLTLALSTALLLSLGSAHAQDEPSIFDRTSTRLKAPETPSNAADASQSQRMGADWLASAQGADGGWSAGQRGQAKAAELGDVATTAYAVMALNRDALGTERHGPARLKGIEFVVKAIETAPEGPRLNTPQGTQPQAKLGALVDTHFAAQMLGQVVDGLAAGELKDRASKAYDLVLTKVQQSQSTDGSFDRGGWASQLSTGVATEALEVAKEKNREVDEQVLDRAQARNEQVANLGDDEAFDVSTSAGVALYSAATTTRSAKKAKDRKMASGRSYQSEVQIGAKGARAAGNSGVLAGFGSAGGEENLSYNMIADTLAEEGGQEWVEWNENISKTLMSSQNANGSWVGHHCITSPVFVTAGAVMTLSAGSWAEYQKKAVENTPSPVAGDPAQ